MTTLQMPQWPRPERRPIPEWGTGKLKGTLDLWTPRTPTWQLSGNPVTQYYGLTKLQLSKVRLSDQLLPDPQNANMIELLSLKPFPAEHPTHAHTSRFAMFPNFDSADDPETGARARDLPTRSARMAAAPHNVMVLEKTKGFPKRHEVQALVAESRRPALVWLPGDDHDQLVRHPDRARRQTYPSPVKTYLPTIPVRSDARCLSGNMAVSARTANALANIERHHAMSTSELSYTGLGTAFAMKLDNLDDKQRQREALCDVDTALRPQGWGTFDPPRRLDGRKEITIKPQRPLHSAIYEHPEPDKTWGRTLTDSERAEHRLWFGKTHVNLPDRPPGGAEQRPLSAPARRHKPASFWSERELKLGDESEAYPYTHYEPRNPHLDLQDHLQRERHAAVQQMEAGSRFTLLDSQTASHDVAALRRKTQLAASAGALPRVFYDHEGRYQRERAGLYGTAYDPALLRGAMEAERRRGAAVIDTSASHVGALDVMTSLNAAAADAMRFNRTLGGPPGSVPQLHPRASLHETMAPLELQKALQTRHLQPDVTSADVRTQEGGLVLTDTTYGADYGTRKFLQEQQLPETLREEPRAIMSHSNQRLSNVRPMTSERCERCPQEGAYGDWELQPADGRLHVHAGCWDGTPCVEHPGPLLADACCPVGGSKYTTGTVPPIGTYPADAAVAAATARRAASTPPGGYPQGDSAACSDLQRSWCNRYAKQSTMPPCLPYDLGSKTDWRFRWRPGQKTRQPQTPLLVMQDGFTKTEARHQFHRDFSENHPPLRDNIDTGKKHVFNDVNLQILR